MALIALLAGAPQEPAPSPSPTADPRNYPRDLYGEDRDLDVATQAPRRVRAEPARAPRDREDLLGPFVGLVVGLLIGVVGTMAAFGYRAQRRAS